MSDDKYPVGFEVKVVGTIYASSKEEAVKRLGEELDIDSDGRRDYMELEEIIPDSALQDMGNAPTDSGDSGAE